MLVHNELKAAEEEAVEEGAVEEEEEEATSTGRGGGDYKLPSPSGAAYKQPARLEIERECKREKENDAGRRRQADTPLIQADGTLSLRKRGGGERGGGERRGGERGGGWAR